MRHRLAGLGLYGAWLGLAVLGVITAFQLHVTLVFFGLRAVEMEAVNKLGWNTSTIGGLSRFLYLVIGALWLVMVLFLEGYLREGQAQHRLKARTAALALSLAGLYILCYLVLLVLS